MLEESLQYHAWDPARITIKVPSARRGLRVLHQLAKRGIKTNVTCLMAMNQAYLAALAGATYVSIFSGRVRDMGYDVKPGHRGHARTSSTARARVEDHRRLDAPHDGRQRGARVRRARADGDAADPAQDGVEPAHHRDDREFNNAWRDRAFLRDLLVVDVLKNALWIISVPNYAVWYNRLATLFGRQRYAWSGLWDRTHLRFYTRRTVSELLEYCGMAIVDRACTPSIVQSAAPLLRKGFERDVEQGDHLALANSPVYKLYQSLVEPVESRACELWPELLGFQIVHAARIP
jgi:hypothetical protein